MSPGNSDLDLSVADNLLNEATSNLETLIFFSQTLRSKFLGSINFTKSAATSNAKFEYTKRREKCAKSN
ncbi:hypothetical protein ABKV19_004243 [Rosa sericea]